MEDEETTTKILPWSSNSTIGKYQCVSLVQIVFYEVIDNLFIFEFFILQLVYLHRVSFKFETHERQDPIILDWELNSMVDRENKEIMIGGFGKGYLLDEPQTTDKPLQLTDKKRKKKEKAKKPEPSEEDSLMVRNKIRSNFNHSPEQHQILTSATLLII